MSKRGTGTFPLEAKKTERQPHELLPKRIFRQSWHIDQKVLGLPLGVQMLQSFQLQGLLPNPLS